MMRSAHILLAMARTIRLWSFANLLPIPVAFAYDRRSVALLGTTVPAEAVAFAASFLFCTLLWLPLRFFTRKADDEELSDREAYLAVAVGWILVAILAMVPLLMLSTFASPVDALLEAMSGITATGLGAGAPETMGRAVLFWRALLHWAGGLAIIVLMVALLFRLTHGGVRLFQAEAVGQSSRVRPRLLETARTLAPVYAAITLALAALLYGALRLRVGLGPKDALFEALCTAMSAYATGGFATHSEGIAWFGDPAVEAVVWLAMVLGATNFSLVFLLARRLQGRPMLRSVEWRFFMAILAVGTVLATVMLWLGGKPPISALREAAFNVASVYTGTGWASADYAAWPSSGLLLLLLLMFAGGMAGSAAGGIKAVRWLVLFKIVTRELRRLLHPRAVIPIRLGERIVEERTVSTVVAFFLSYMVLWAAGAGLLVVLEPGLGVLDGSALSAAALGNVGGSLGATGPGDAGVAALGMLAKVVLAALMWLGRLEIFTAVLLFLPQSWKH